MYTARGIQNIIMLAFAGVLATIVAQKVFAQSEEPPTETTSAEVPSSTSVDGLIKEGYLQRNEAPPEVVESPPVKRSLWAVNLGLGMTFGGDDLVTAFYTDGSEETLTAGTGFNLTIGTTVTPFRVGHHSAGLGLDFGVKGWNIGGRHTDFQLNMTRFPLILSAHYGYDIGSGVSLMAAGGLQTEFGVNLSGSGELSGTDMDLDNAVGGTVEVGVILESHSFGVDCTLRYTGIGYGGNALSGRVSGNSFGFFLALHLNLLRTIVD